jgi:hypothetical protein
MDMNENAAPVEVSPVSVGFPFIPFFPGSVPFLKETFFGAPKCPDFKSARYISHSHHCSNAICQYPTQTIRKFSVYHWFLRVFV